MTLRVCPEVFNLRSKRCFVPIRAALLAASWREGFRLIHYSVQGNHLHLIVEASDARRLARGVQGLTVRAARALNKVMRRKGRVFAERYHSRALRTPTEVHRAMRYVHDNRAIHRGRLGLAVGDGDACGSGDEPVVSPRTWLLQCGWRRSVDLR